jgi:hypothetical protein
MIRVCRPVVLSFTLGALLLVGLAGFATESVVETIAQADAEFVSRYVPETMNNAIALYEAALPALDTLPVQSQAHVLNRLSQLCYEATMFTPGNTREDEALFIKGKNYGFQSLRLNEEFVAHERAGLTAALTHVRDPMATHWAANNWGMVLEMNPFQGLMEQGSVVALFERTIELDRDFWGGSAASALGSLLIMVPGFMGGNAQRGLALVEESIEMDPSYLHNRIILAEYWGFTYNMFGSLTGVRDADLIVRETALVLAAGIGDWPFWNRQAKAEAERLLGQLQEMTD